MKSVFRHLACVAFGWAALGALPAAAADAPGCKDPAWAPQRLAGYDISGCETKAWAKLELSLVKGNTTVYGSRTEVHYSLRAGAKDHPNAEVRDYYGDLAVKAGGQYGSRPHDGWGAAVSRNTPQGAEWMQYRHGSGNDMSTGSFTLTTLDVMPLQQDAAAQPMSGTLDVKAKPCANPPWLKKPLSGFKLDGCEGKAWDSVELSLADGDKTIEGRRLTVSYKVLDEKNEPTAMAVRQNYVTALQATGAKLMSRPDDENRAVLTQKTASGGIWYVYKHGSGNEDSTGSYSLTTIVVTPFLQEVVAQPMTAPLSAQGKACIDPPWLKKQFDYFKLAGCSYRDVDSITLGLPDGQKTLVGRFMTVDYTLTDPTRDPTALTVKKNFVNALTAIGAKQIGNPNDGYKAVLTQKTPVGDMWYVYTHGNGNENSTGSYSLLSVEVGGPPPKTCTLEVYGVNFDFNKATLRPEAEPVLQQVLALFTADPAYSAEVGGHTDNIGKKTYNMKLSAARADAVKAWLVAHGVAASRLTSQGYGDTRPLVPNTTDENRFKNRRVELKRNNCKP